jgi:predicted transcriptional regulator
MIELEKAGLERDASILRIATPDPVCCDERASIAEFVDLIFESGMRRIPIVSRGRLTGLLSTSDILDAFLRSEDFSNPVSTIMVRDVIYCLATDTIGFVLQKMKLSRRGGFPVLKGKRVVGIVTERDFIKPFAKLKFGVRVGDSMTPNPLFISPELSILDCLKSLVNTRFRRMPVVRNGELVGLVTTADLLRFIHEREYEQEALRKPLSLVIVKMVRTISPAEDLGRAVQRMIKHGIGGLIVTEDSRVKGILTERDVLVEII